MEFTYASPFDSYSLEEVNELLRDPYADVRAILDLADEDAWEFLYANRHTYPAHIRALIEPADFLPSKLRMRVRDVTEEEIKCMRLEERNAKKKEFDVLWEGSLKQTIPPRPCDDLDDQLDDAWATLENAKKALAEYTSRKSYTVPSARNRIDPKKASLQSTVDVALAAYKVLETKSEQADLDYMNAQKEAAFRTWLTA